ncbi:hypothetical protein CISIN_1g042370mg [Citrus sinensis]|uniref:FAS1 domain-containing protein n=1 Tax=Citrus sinensis TaxID=2711 RepID=A0A067DC35_CITSI|nr:hypothetical protein CISIN_1g042370mg [Citrus sinensis]
MAAFTNSLQLVTIFAFYLLIITKSAAFTDLETLFTATPLQKQATSLVSDFNDQSSSPGRCITVTSSKSQNDTVSEAFIGGVEITRPDLFNNGIIVIHGIQGDISPLSPLSCEVQRMTWLPFLFQSSDHEHYHWIEAQPLIMSLMLRDAMLRLQNNGFSMLSLAMKVNCQELITLTTMTVFALDDMSIFSSSLVYISNVRLPVGTTLPTLKRGQSLTVTRAGVVTGPLRINLVRVMVPDIMNNLKIVVYGVNLPFPYFGATAFDTDSIGLTDTDGGEYSDVVKPTAAAGTNILPNSLLTAVSTNQNIFPSSVLPDIPGVGGQ